MTGASLALKWNTRCAPWTNAVDGTIGQILDRTRNWRKRLEEANVGLLVVCNQPARYVPSGGLIRL